MKLFFKTIDDLSDVVQVFRTMDLDAVKTDVWTAQEELVPMVLGRTLMDELLEKYAEDELNEKETEMVKLVQMMVGNYCAPAFMPKSNIQVKDSGISQRHDENNKPAFQWAIDDASVAYYRTAFRIMDSLFDFLERELEHFESWKESEAFSFFYGNLVFKTDVFQLFVDIRRNRRVFNALKPMMNDAQDALVKTVGPEIVEAFVEGLPDVGEDDRKKAMRKMQQFICHKAMQQGLDGLAITIDDKGVTVYENVDSRVQINNRKNIDSVQLERRIAYHRDKSAEVLADVQKLMKANIGEFPEYEQSASYQEDYQSPATFGKGPVVGI
jgi:hypothetical protein